MWLHVVPAQRGHLRRAFTTRPILMKPGPRDRMRAVALAREAVALAYRTGLVTPAEPGGLRFGAGATVETGWIQSVAESPSGIFAPNEPWRR